MKHPYLKLFFTVFYLLRDYVAQANLKLLFLLFVVPDPEMFDIIFSFIYGYDYGQSYLELIF